MLKKILLSFLASLIVLFSLAPYSSTFAQSTWYNTNPFEWYIKVFDEQTSPPTEIFGERYTAAQVQWVVYGLVAYVFNFPFALFNMSPLPNVCFANAALGTVDLTTCFKATEDFLKAVKEKLLFTSNSDNYSPVAQSKNQPIWKSILLEDRPLSGISYIKNIGRRFHLVPEVQAETYGFTRLDPIQALWKITRNLSYFFFVIIIIMMAFMIMFKIKISPQTVITVQLALPKIILALLLVTFSYAIAGFMVDLVYVAMGIFAQFFPIGDTASTFAFLRGWTGDGFIAILLYSILYLILYFVFTLIIALATLFGGVNVTSFVFALVLLVFTIFLIVLLIYYLFAGIFNLFKALAGFYMAVITGPLQISLGAIPGLGQGFGGWLKNLISKLAVFPAVGILWYFAFLFLFGAVGAASKCASLNLDWQGTIDAANELLISTGAPPNFVQHFVEMKGVQNCWNPPLLGNAAGATAISFLIISLGCIMAITKVPKLIESFLAGKAFDMESAIGKEMKTGGYTAGTYLEGRGLSKAKPTMTAVGRVLQQITKV